MSGDDTNDEYMKRYSSHLLDGSNSKRQRQNGPDLHHMQDFCGRRSQPSVSGEHNAGQTITASHLANLRSSGFLGSLPPPSFTASLTNSYFGNLVDQRIFENAQQQLRQGVDIALISNLFQSPAIPAGNTDFAFSPTISIPVARSMLNSNPMTNSVSLARNSTTFDSTSQAMLSAVALLQGAQANAALRDPFATHQAHWASQGMQSSVEQAVQSAIASARQQEQLKIQHATLTQELLQRYAASAAAATDQSAVASANFKDATTYVPKSKKYENVEEGALLAIHEDRCKLNDQQVFLRQQIEAYRATEDDMTSHTRGRNKPVVLGQVGIRCKHCCHLPASQRGKGSTYFPSTLMGIYQAAQNMSVEHLQSGICGEMPPDVRTRFLTFGLTKPGASVAGKRYWAEAGKRIGLVDTEHGIRFAKDEEEKTAKAAEESSAQST